MTRASTSSLPGYPSSPSSLILLKTTPVPGMRWDSSFGVKSCDSELSKSGVHSTASKPTPPPCRETFGDSLDSGAKVDVCELRWRVWDSSCTGIRLA